MLHSPRLLVPALLLTAGTLAGCSGSSGSASPAASTTSSPTSSTVALAGADLTAAIADTTHTGEDESGPYTEYYAADGKVKGKDYTGIWVIKGDKACFTYPPEAEVCYSVAKDSAKADTLIWTADGAKPTTTTFKSGDQTGF